MGLIDARLEEYLIQCLPTPVVGGEDNRFHDPLETFINDSAARILHLKLKSLNLLRIFEYND